MTHTKFEIPFTQYLLPNGKQRKELFLTEREDVYDKAMNMIEAGLWFEIEMLTTGHVSVTVSGLQQLEEGDEPEAQDLAFAIAANGPPLVEKIERMIMKFDIPEDGIVRSWKSDKTQPTA
jgi:hypothetical protein